MSTTATELAGQRDRRPPDLRAVLFAAAAGLLGLSLLFEPAGLSSADSIGYGLRVTARLSFTFFILAYLARPLFQLATGGLRSTARVLLRNRRYLGLCAAFVHTVHFGYVVAFVILSGEAVALVTLVGGGLAFLLFWLMALTSNDAAVRWLGVGWKRLHRFGMHYIWLIFMQSFIPRAFEDPGYLIPSIAGVLGLVLRMAAHRRARP